MKGQEDTPMPEECIPEMKAKDQRLAHNLLVAEEQSSLSQILHCEQYSTIHRLL